MNYYKALFTTESFKETLASQKDKIIVQTIVTVVALGAVALLEAVVANQSEEESVETPAE